MTGPFTGTTTHVEVTIGWYCYIKVSSYVPGLAYGAQLGLVRSISFKNLYEMLSRHMARMQRNRRCGFIRVSGVSQPIHELPSFLGRVLQMLAEFLITTSAA